MFTKSSSTSKCTTERMRVMFQSKALFRSRTETLNFQSKSTEEERVPQQANFAQRKNS